MEENANTVPDQIPVQQQDMLKYTPSSVEKKRAVIMYALFGIIMSVNKDEIWDFEYYHLRQSAWWWVCFVFLFLLSAILLFIPVIKFLWIIPLVLMICLLVYFVKQAWDWKYIWVEEKSGPLQIFSWIGTWLLDLFEIKVKSASSLIDDVNMWKVVNSPTGEIPTVTIPQQIIEPQNTQNL